MEETSTSAGTTTYVVAKLRTSDNMLGFGAEWAYTDYGAPSGAV